jgi:hypothetical protein
MAAEMEFHPPGMWEKRTHRAESMETPSTTAWRTSVQTTAFKPPMAV